MNSNKLHPLIPDFLIIGAGKSGTTSLDNYLRQHPELFLPPLKEPNFYGYELLDNRQLTDEDDRQHYQNSVTNFKSYIELFRDAGPGTVTGETSNTYMYHEMAPSRIRHYNPDVKLIAILRQPAERLWSRYLHLAREKRMSPQEINSCTDRNSVWWRRNDLIREGFYFKNLSRFYLLFPESQIKIYLYEEFSKNGYMVMKDIFKFLNVDCSFSPNLKVQYNSSGFIKNKMVDRILGPTGFIQKSAKHILNKGAYNALKKSIFLQSLTNRIRKKNLEKPKMDSEIRRYLIEDVYSKDIEKLQALIKKDLSHWMM